MESGWFRMQEIGDERPIEQKGRPMADNGKTDEKLSLGKAPASGGVDDDIDTLRERCKTERDTMAPRETADCAGTDLAEEYENEEDGGS